MEYVDIAGLVKGASQGEGLGNQFLSHIREVDAICHVVRAFDDENISHVHGKVDPLEDISVINYELILADLDSLEKQYSKIQKTAKSNKEHAELLPLMEKIINALKEGKNARSVIDKEERKIAHKFNLITSKPVLYCANILDSEIKTIENNKHIKKIKEIASGEGSEVVVLCGKIEVEIS